MPLLNRFRKKTEPLPLESVTFPKDRERIPKTVRATELYAFISSIAMGVLQILSVEFDAPELRAQLRYGGAPAGDRIKEEAALIRRLLEYRNNCFARLACFELPVTNNPSERSLRDAKTHMKVYGQFRWKFGFLKNLPCISPLRRKTV